MVESRLALGSLTGAEVAAGVLLLWRRSLTEVDGVHGMWKVPGRFLLDFERRLGLVVQSGNLLCTLMSLWTLVHHAQSCID